MTTFTPEELERYKALNDWLDSMHYESVSEAVRALGCSRRAFDGWVQGLMPPPHYILLACAALAVGMKPYSAPMEEAK